MIKQTYSIFLKHMIRAFRWFLHLIWLTLVSKRWRHGGIHAPLQTANPWRAERWQRNKERGVANQKLSWLYLPWGVRVSSFAGPSYCFDILAASARAVRDRASFLLYLVVPVRINEFSTCWIWRPFSCSWACWRRSTCRNLDERKEAVSGLGDYVEIADSWSKETAT